MHKYVQCCVSTFSNFLNLGFKWIIDKTILAFCNQCFGSGSDFFLSLDPDKPKIQIQSEKIQIRIREKNVLKLEKK